MEGRVLLASLRKDHYRIINSQHLSRLPSGPPSAISLSLETLFQLINPLVHHSGRTSTDIKPRKLQFSAK